MATIQEPSTERSALLTKLFTKAMCPDKAVERLASVSLKDDPTAGVGVTQEVILQAAKQMPEQQERLADLLIGLSLLPSVEHDTEALVEKSSPISPDSPTPGSDLISREWTDLRIPEEPGMERNIAIEQFVNINAFAARLMRIAPQVFELELIALLVMRQGLETPIDQMTPSEPAELWIPAAAAWIAQAGYQIYHWTYDFSQKGNLAGVGGPLWSGKYAFCPERWDLWKARFQDLASSSDLNDKLRACAQEAAALMQDIEDGSEA